MTETKKRQTRTKSTASRAGTAARPKRIPVSGNRNILTVENQDPAYVYRWVNDTHGRIERFKTAGYEFVDHDVNVGERKVETSGSTGSVVSKDVGQGVTAFLMRIKREWYEEDQAAKHAEIAKSEESMKRELNSKEDGSYGNVSFDK